MCFLQCQKGLLSEHPSGVKVFVAPIFHSSKTNWFGKYLLESHPRCKDCLLTHWWLITCILLILERNSWKQFKLRYLKNQKQFMIFLLPFWNYIKFCTFWKKGSPWWVKYFGSYWLRKICFFECWKGLVSEHPPGVKVVAGPKHCSNLHGIVFILIFHYSKIKWVRKLLSELDPKCKDSFVTRWLLIPCILLIVGRNSRTSSNAIILKSENVKTLSLTRWRLITSILFIVETNSRNQFKDNYLKNQKQFLISVLHFLSLHEIFHIWKKKVSLMAQIFWKLLTPKYVLLSMPKSSCLRTPFESQGVGGSQALLRSARHYFYLNFPLIQDNLSLKTCLWDRSKI